MGKRLSKVEKDLLKLLDGAEGGILYLSSERVESLVAKGYAEQNPGMVEDDKLATRMTEAGLTKLEGLREPEPEVESEPIDTATKDGEKGTLGGYVGEVEPEEDETEVVEVEPEPEVAPEPEPVSVRTEVQGEFVEPEESGIELDKGIDITSLPRKVRGSYKYPFEKMEVGDSFHVAATEKRPKPSRTLASTVSSASKKFEKVFRVRTVDERDPKGPGARVFRLE